ncbi:hypothetical protein QLQ15_08000 [Lysobacter sp. LF1]|uniref:Uncharacterized protein n=1 Tax=Lysobacter stagni TaxID=3045172 RepID=A0ABT6XFD5_9GAMM|nr:hypothetical protein [Lysobacter sp. LF1]MDI9238856.1 hypothetical protein [Lysobacter sp. LF1]
MLLVALAFCQGAVAQEGTGTLTVNVAQFTSEKELPKKVDKQLRNGGLEWGIKDDLLVFTTVAKQFIDHPVNHMTRYSQSETLTLPAGTYRITGIGLEMSTGFSVQKILDKGAFVNQDVLSFTIEPGKTTTLNITPVIYKDATFALNFWVPTLMASVQNESGSTPAVALNQRGASSIAWPQYHGPLKFVAK